MASFFIPGEQKVRPGVFFRYENWGLPPIAGADDGRCAAVFRSNWGPINRPTPIENFADIARTYGDGGANGTLAVPFEQFRGGARLTFAMRLGTEGIASPGTPGTFTITDNATPTPAPVIQLTMNQNNNTPYQLYIGPTTGDPDVGEIALLLGAANVETLTFDISTGADQIAGLLAAGAASTFYTLTLIADTGNPLAIPTVAPIVPGTNPVASATPGRYDIQDDAATAVLRMIMLHPGSRPFSVTIRPTLQDENLMEFLLLDGTTILERFTYDGQADDPAAELMATVARRGSNFFTMTRLAASTEPLAIIDQVPITPGTDPEINVAAYSAAFEALEPFRWNVLSIDTNDRGVQMLMQMYLNRIYRGGGQFTMGVIGEDRTVPFDTRIQNASAYNDYQIVYVGTGFIDMMGVEYEGWMAAARIAGLIAGTPSNESITRLGITGATLLTEPLSNFDYERSITAGMLTFSTSSANTVWVESGINTLVLPGTTEDDGWKKIKRVKVRFELFQRLNDTVERLVGRINNDPDGRMTVIQSGNAVCNAMMAERKLLAGARLETDPDNAPRGDSAWFLVFADDIDALEKMYFTFKFRFAPDEAV
jgi:hypothetical protein